MMHPKNFPIKSTFLVAIAGLGAVCAAYAGPEQSSQTFIPATLDVPAFVPPAPPVEKKVPVMRIDAAVSVSTATGHTLTVLRGEASTLPDIPAPVVVEQRPAREPTPEEFARDAEVRRRYLQFNAVVYANGVSVIRWQHPDPGKSYEAICGFDINLLAGVGRFTNDGKIYQLSFLPPGVLRIPRRHIPGNPIPKPPQAAPDTLAITRGNALDFIGTSTATLLRDLIASEKSRLIVYQEKRAAWQQTAAAWQKAHPIFPRPETVWLRPHRGSRYLTNPVPENGSSR